MTQSLEISRYEQGPATVLKLVGELDLLGSEQMEGWVKELTAKPPKLLVFDLSELTFLASTGMGSLEAIARSVKKHGGRSMIAAPPNHVKVALVSARITDLIPIVESIEDGIKQTQAR